MSCDRFPKFLLPQDVLDIFRQDTEPNHWIHSHWCELRDNPVIQQWIVSPMTTCPIQLFSKSVVFVITMFYVADLRLHRFEDRLNVQHFHVLDGALGVLIVFAEVCCPHTRCHECVCVLHRFWKAKHPHHQHKSTKNLKISKKCEKSVGKGKKREILAPTRTASTRSAPPGPPPLFFQDRPTPTTTWPHLDHPHLDHPLPDRPHQDHPDPDAPPGPPTPARPHLGPHLDRPRPLHSFWDRATRTAPTRTDPTQTLPNPFSSPPLPAQPLLLRPDGRKFKFLKIKNKMSFLIFLDGWLKIFEFYFLQGVWDFFVFWRKWSFCGKEIFS